MRRTAIVATFALGATSFAHGGHIQHDIRAGSVKSRGVNLGGWLVAENWMTSSSDIWQGMPNDVKGQGEFKVMEKLGPQAGYAKFQQHRSTWITEADIQQIALSNLNTVRVPVGYWIQGCDHFSPGVLKTHCSMYAPGGLDYLDKLIRDWAWKHNVAVLISVHGAPGSQNGHDHSGAEDSNIWWSKYNENVQATHDFAVFLATRYKNDNAFLGIGLLNEPTAPYSEAASRDKNGVDFDTMADYYKKVYAQVRSVSDCILSISPLLSNQGPGNGMNMDDFAPEMTNVWHEWHPYVIWGYDNMSEDQLISQGVAGRANDIYNWKGKPLFLGEWSLTTQWPTFNDPGRFGQLATKMVSMAQAAGGGWTYWSWKKSGDEGGYIDKWSLRSLLNVANGVTPSGDEKAIAIYDSTGKSLTTRDDAYRLVNDKAWIAQMGRATEWLYSPKTQALHSTLDRKCLDGYELQNGQYQVHTYDCYASNPNQGWQLVDHAIVHAKSSLCLTADLSLATCDQSKTNQYFNIGTERTQILGPYDVAYSTQNGRVKLNATSHAWIIDHAKMTVQDTTTGKCLDAYQPQNGGIVHMWDCTPGNPNQMWRYDAASKQLRHATHDGFCLDVYGNGAGQHLYQCHDTNDQYYKNQIFRLVWQDYEGLV
ncbi:unnamed protein product [Aphanomyces euteiches]